MISPIINEKDYAERLLHDLCTDDNPYYALSIIARYYYHNAGYRKKRIITLLTKYLYSHYLVEEYDKLDWSERIERISNNARKNPLIDVSSIKITSAEMKTVDSITGAALKRLAFTLLCLAKLNNLRNKKNNGWLNYSSKDVFALANISCSSYEREVKLGILYRYGLLEFPKRNDNLSYRVTFIDNESEPVMFVDDIRVLGYQYMNYHDGGFVQCCECGVYMRDKAGDNTPGRKRLYCDNCAAPKPMETKIVKCSDCGIQFVVNSKNNVSKRCPYCSNEHRKEYLRKYMRDRRGSEIV